MRLSFVINESSTVSELLKIFEFNSTIWGGYYNIIVPTDGCKVFPQ